MTDVLQTCHCPSWCVGDHSGDIAEWAEHNGDTIAHHHESDGLMIAGGDYTNGKVWVGLLWLECEDDDQPEPVTVTVADTDFTIDNARLLAAEILRLVELAT